jgi:3'-phosphoadenosine 5'-phosphosulfate sulfotransferase
MEERNKCAVVRMEEMYLRLTVEYSNVDTMNEISDTIKQVEEEMKLYPNVVRRAINDHAGNFSVEFDAENDCTREAGKFFEKVMKKLGIDKCQ